MITYEMITEAQESLVKHWGEDGKRVVEECAKVTPFNGDVKTFLEYYTCCGGNWGSMLLSGIKRLYINVWVAIPDNM